MCAEACDARRRGCKEWLLEVSFRGCKVVSGGDKAGSSSQAVPWQSLVAECIAPDPQPRFLDMAASVSTPTSMHGAPTTGAYCICTWPAPHG